MDNTSAEPGQVLTPIPLVTVAMSVKLSELARSSHCI